LEKKPNQDEYYMQIALRLAARGLGTTFPNPSVGCVVVKNNHIIGQGVTGKGGRPHAETIALAMAGNNAKGATAYITLEPCCHDGKTSPCTNALIAAGIARIVVAVKDPDSRVNGKGLTQVREAGIELTLGVCEQEAHELNEGFFLMVEKQRPLVTLKLATSLDGKIATASGESKWITGESSRAYGQLLRAQHDAIMVGVNTVIADNPALTCRLPGLEDRSPIRIIMDTHLRTPMECTVITTASTIPTWIVTSANKTIPSVETLTTPTDNSGHVKLSAALSTLAGRGITRLLVEGGGTLAAAMLKAGLVDRLIWFRSPKIIGNDGIPAVNRLSLEKLLHAPYFTRQSVRVCGDDVVEHLSRQHVT
jgi:diaminohydroxyphosphoribosylaminopyrimidine deaminase / 5-amino-6-(5-phosphoribosylamino)uracil reductase